MSANPIVNLGKVFKNKTVSMFQNPEALKTDSLLLASLVLVISRILVANISAVRAQGTKDGPYRYRESIRTDIREVCGWTFGFVVLRQVQKWIKDAMQKPLGITKVGEPPNYGLFKNIYKSFTQEGPEALSLNLATTEKLLYEAKKACPSALGLLGKIKNMTGKSEAGIAKTLYRAVPIAVGSIPAVFLAGYALERFTRDYSDQVVDMVGSILNRPNANQPVPAAAPSATPTNFTYPATPQPSPVLDIASQPVAFGRNRFAGRQPLPTLQPQRPNFSPVRL